MSRFDEIIDRKGTFSVKYDKLKLNFGREDLTPLWVADMEFRSPDCIKEVLQDYVEGGVYGYNVEPAGLHLSIMEWLLKTQNWKVENEWLTFIPGIVRGIGYAVNYFTEKGDKILVQTPVYHPFMLVPKGNERELVFNPLHRSEPFGEASAPVSASQVYSFDFENLEKVTEENDIKMLILCNPHNPGGIKWTRGDLQRIAHICYIKKILVISDEIHADLQLWGGKHIPFATVSEEAAQNSITFGAPSKTFNIPGLASSFAVIPNKELRKGFYNWLTANELNDAPITSSIATVAAYTKGDSWRREALEYIEKNIVFTENFFSQNLPEIRVIRPEASFLVWLDCREFLRKLSNKGGAPDAEDQKLLVDYFVNKARLALNDGSMFGPEGIGYMRLNVACPRQMLETALRQLL